MSDNIRQRMFPYGMARNPDGSWTIFNRRYKPVGVMSDEYAEWDDERHTIFIKGPSKSQLQKLSVRASDQDKERIYFYNDETNPELSSANMAQYLDKLRILMSIQAPRDQ